MSLTLSAHTARTLSDIEYDQLASRHSINSTTTDRATAVEEDFQSIPLDNCPQKYKQLSLLDNNDPLNSKCNDSIENHYMKRSSSHHTINSLSKQKRRRLIIRKVAYIVIMNAAIPIALYYILKPHLPTVWALVVSSTPTIISVIIQAIFMKRIDSIGVAVIFGFILSVLLAVLNGDPKLLLLRESFVTAGVGVVCGITLLPLKYKSFELKPVLYYLAKDLIPMEQVHFLDKSKPPQSRMEFFWQNSQYCRFHFRLLTAIDIVILELEFGLKLYYILNFDIDTVVVLSNSTLSIIGIIVSISTIGYIFQIRRRLKKDEHQMLLDAQAVI